MTVSTELSHEEYVGNGVTTDFDFRFRIFEGKHLIVVVADSDGNETTLKNGTDYTIVGAGSYHGGKVVLNKPLAQGWKILLERDLPVVQETDLRNQGKFFAEVHEDAFDYLTMLIQKALGTFSLSLRKPTYLSNYYDAKGNRIANLALPKFGSDSANKDYVDNSIKYIDSKTLRVNDKDIPSLPNADDRAGKVLTFDKAGYPIAVAPASGSAIDVINQIKNGDGSIIGFDRSDLKALNDFNLNSFLSFSQVNIFEFSHLVTNKPSLTDNTTWDWSPAIQAAVNSGRDVYIPDIGGAYIIDAPINVTRGVRIIGDRGRTLLKKTTNTSGNITRKFGDIEYKYDKPCIFNLIAPNDSYLTYFSIDGVNFDTADDYSVSVFDSYRSAYASYRNIICLKSDFFFIGNDSWMNLFECVRSRFSRHHWYCNGGTSNVWINCHADRDPGQGSGTGFELIDMYYSTLIGCGVDTLGVSYAISGGNVSFNGSGTESFNRLLVIDNGATVTLNDCRLLFTLNNSTNGTSRTPFDIKNDSKVIFIGGEIKFESYVSIGTPDFSRVSTYIIPSTSNGNANIKFSDVLFSLSEAGINSKHPFGRLNGSITYITNGEIFVDDGYSLSNSTIDNKYLSSIYNDVTIPHNEKKNIARIGTSYGDSMIVNIKIDGFSPATGSGIGCLVSHESNFYIVNREPKKKITHKILINEIENLTSNTQVVDFSVSMVISEDGKYINILGEFKSDLGYFSSITGRLSIKCKSFNGVAWVKKEILLLE